MLEGFGGFLDVGEELEGEFFALLVRLRQVYDLRAFGFRHLGGIIGGVVVVVRLLGKVRGRPAVSRNKFRRGILLRTPDPILAAAARVRDAGTITAPRCAIRSLIVMTMLRR